MNHTVRPPRHITFFCSSLELTTSLLYVLINDIVTHHPTLIPQAYHKYCKPVVEITAQDRTPYF